MFWFFFFDPTRLLQVEWMLVFIIYVIVNNAMIQMHTISVAVFIWIDDFALTAKIPFVENDGD